MSEKRYYDYGRPDQATEKIAAQALLHVPGVLSGGTLDTDTLGTLIQLAAHAVITPDGVVIVNDNQRTITFTPVSAAIIYTVVIAHTYSTSGGGSGSDLELRDNSGTGALNQADITDGVVMGWLDYPGGSVVLTDSMFYSARPAGTVSPNLAFGAPPSPWPDGYSPGMSVTLDPLGDVTSAHTIDGTTGAFVTTWTNAHAATTETVTVVLAAGGVDTPSAPWGAVTVTNGSSAAWSDVAANVTATININGTSTVLGTYTGALAAGATGEIATEVPLGVIPLSGDTWSLQLVFSLPPLATIAVSGFSISNIEAPV